MGSPTITTNSPNYSNPGNGYYTVMPSAHQYSAAPEFETVDRAEPGDVSECRTCPRALECLADALPRSWMIAGTRKDSQNAITLPCIDAGTTRLVPIRLKTSKASGTYDTVYGTTTLQTSQPYVISNNSK
jgi:hypothetical protein